jgi:ribose-phosphate pyrophosphokinase
MARSYAGRLNAPLAIVDKRRISSDQAEAGSVIGDVKGKNVLVCDDMISTAGSLVAAVEVLLKHGAQDIHIAATHPVLSGPAYERLESCPIRQITVSDTIPIRDNLGSKIRVLSIAPLLASAIGRIHSNKSVSTLFV